MCGQIKNTQNRAIRPLFPDAASRVITGYENMFAFSIDLTAEEIELQSLEYRGLIHRWQLHQHQGDFGAVQFQCLSKPKYQMYPFIIQAPGQRDSRGIVGICGAQTQSLGSHFVPIRKPGQPQLELKAGSFLDLSAKSIL
jgi:hypothetical protein